MELLFKSINKGNVKELFESVKTYREICELGLAYNDISKIFFLTPSVPRPDVVLFSLDKYMESNGEVDCEKFFNDFYCECCKMKISF